MSRPSRTCAKTLPMTANWARLSASHSRLAPRSSMTLSPREVGRNEASAGRCAPSSMRMANIEMASSAPVLPADTTVSARPWAAASTASHMLDLRRRRSAKDGLSSAARHLRPARSRAPVRGPCACRPAASAAPRRRTAGTTCRDSVRGRCPRRSRRLQERGRRPCRRVRGRSCPHSPSRSACRMPAHCRRRAAAYFSADAASARTGMSSR